MCVCVCVSECNISWLFRVIIYRQFDAELLAERIIL